MPFISTKRNRRRYIAFQIVSADNVQFHRKQVINSIQSACFHQFNTSCKTYDFFLTRFNHNVGILRCNHTEKEKAIKLLQSITHLDNKPVEIKTIATSGTMKALIKKHLNGDSLQDKKNY